MVCSVCVGPSFYTAAKHAGAKLLFFVERSLWVSLALLAALFVVNCRLEKFLTILGVIHMYVYKFQRSSLGHPVLHLFINTN